MTPKKESSGSSGNLQFRSELLAYVGDVERTGTPQKVLNDLHAVTWPHLRIGVIGAAQFPLRWGDYGGLEKGRSVFIHASVPCGWWDEYLELSKQGPAPGVMLA